MMNKVYFDLVSRENYNRGETVGFKSGVQVTEQKYANILAFLQEQRNKKHYLSKKIKKLLEEANL